MPIFCGVWGLSLSCTFFDFCGIALRLHLNMSDNIYRFIFESHNCFPKKLNKLRKKNRNIDIFFVLLLNIIKGVWMKNC